jgi:hypothetical protein
VLVLLMGEIYDVSHYHGLGWHDICTKSFVNTGTGVQAILRFYLRNLRGRNVGITDWQDIYDEYR